LMSCIFMLNNIYFMFPLHSKISIFVHNIMNEYSVKMCTSRTKKLHLKGKNLEDNKIVLGNKIFEHVRNFNHLICSIGYETDSDVNINLINFINSVEWKHLIVWNIKYLLVNFISME
jgi:hypothetical protein